MAVRSTRPVDSQIFISAAPRSVVAIFPSSNTRKWLNREDYSYSDRQYEAHEPVENQSIVTTQQLWTIVEEDRAAQRQSYIAMRSKQRAQNFMCSRQPHAGRKHSVARNGKVDTLSRLAPHLATDAFVILQYQPHTNARATPAGWCQQSHAMRVVTDSTCSHRAASSFLACTKSRNFRFPPLLHPLHGQASS